MAAKKSRRSRGDGALFYRADRDRSIGRISVNGTPRTVSARTKTEARYKLDQLRRAADDGLPVITRDRTVAELLELWRTKALPNRDLSPARIASHDWAIRILTHELGTIKLQALTVDDVEAALTRRTIPPPTNNQHPAKDADGPRRVRSHGTRSIKLRSTLSQALTWAQRRDLVTRNVAALAELPTGATTRQNRQITQRRTSTTTPRRCRRNRVRSDVDPDALLGSPTGRSRRTVLEQHRLPRRHHPHLACPHHQHRRLRHHRRNQNPRQHPHPRSPPSRPRVTRTPPATTRRPRRHTRSGVVQPRQPGVHLTQRTTRRPESRPQRIRPTSSPAPASTADGPPTCCATPPPA